ncbi:MAG: hypothetical protein ACREJL_01250 [Candidatus Methylomirabilales bacterium]
MWTVEGIDEGETVPGLQDIAVTLDTVIRIRHRLFDSHPSARTKLIRTEVPRGFALQVRFGGHTAVVIREEQLDAFLRRFEWT